MRSLGYWSALCLIPGALATVKGYTQAALDDQVSRRPRGAVQQTPPPLEAAEDLNPVACFPPMTFAELVMIANLVVNASDRKAASDSRPTWAHAEHFSEPRTTDSLACLTSHRSRACQEPKA